MDGGKILIPHGIKAVSSVVDALNYINRFLARSSRSYGPGWLPVYQENLCCVYDKIMDANDGKFPVFLRYSRREKCFTIFRRDGTTVTVENK